ncbi:MAG: zinc-binding dehydrogenase [Bryobacterales bacterium]|nr:zinc-binding dehydrogenase [Bryobacterales bacterium]
MTKQMMAAVLYGKENLKVEPVAVPSIDSGDILVRVKAALTCGTDVKVFRRGYHARMIVPPALFGHELAGDVVAVGSGVAKFSKGDRVVAANSAPCGQCFYCRKGNENLCDDLLFNNGAYAEYMRIPARIVEKNTYRIPDHIQYQDAALIEPLACVLRGLEETGLSAGDTVSVIGLGPIGLMFVRLAKIRGSRVIAIGRRRSQVDRAAQIGADELLVSDGSDIVSECRRLTDGYGVDVAIEAVGIPETWEQAVRMVRRGGTVNFFGGCPSDSRISLETQLLHYSEITCKASFHHTPRHVQEALDIVSRGEITAADFVNRVEPLTNLLEVMRHLMSHNGHMKTAIIP